MQKAEKFSVPKSYSALKGGNSFSKVRTGKAFFSENFILNGIKTNSPLPSLGLITTKKIYKKAVFRNKAKRRARHLFTLALQQEQNSLKGLSLSIVIRPGFIEQDFEVLCKSFFKSLGILLQKIDSRGKN